MSANFLVKIYNSHVIFYMTTLLLCAIPIDLFHKLPETGFICIFILFVILCILTISPVIFDLCEIAAMHFNYISCDTYERSFQTKYIISLTNLQVYLNHQTATSALVLV